jgi:hypothetical protein
MKRRKKRPEPFYRRFDGWWYVQIGKQQIKLAKGLDNEDAAWREYFRVMAQQGPAQPAAPLRSPTVTAVCNLFLDFSANRSPEEVSLERRLLDEPARVTIDSSGDAHRLQPCAMVQGGILLPPTRPQGNGRFLWDSGGRTFTLLQPIWLIHPEEAMCAAFRQRFAGLPKVRVRPTPAPLRASWLAATVQFERTATPWRMVISS